MKKIITLLIMGFTLISVAQESVLLRYKYNKGDKFETKIDLKQDVPFVGKMDMGMTMIIEVLNVKDTVYDVSMSFSHFTTTTEKDGQLIKYDSSVKESEMNEEEKATHQKMKAMLDMVVGAKMTNRGAFSDFKIIKGEGDASQFQSQMSNSLVFPQNAVKVGDSWSAEHKEQGMDMKSTYTLKKINEKDVDIVLDGKVSGMMAGAFTGNMKVIKETGVTAKSDMNMEIGMFGQTMKSKATSTTEKK